MSANSLTERITFYRKLAEAALDGQPRAVMQRLFTCLAAVTRQPLTEAVEGGVVLYGVRYTIRTWRCPETESLGIDCVAEVDGGLVEVSYVVRDGSMIELGGVRRAPV